MARPYGNSRGVTRRMTRISSPYNFVPLSEHVVFPAWGNPVLTSSDKQYKRGVVSHDRPFEDGIDGTLSLEIEAHTPIFTRSADGKQSAEFFTDPDGNKALPGSSIRGLVRNVVEIAGFGKLGRVNDLTYGIRDLHNRHTYGQYMAEIGRNGQPTPLVNAGWLSKVDVDNSKGDNAKWTIEACHFAKVSYGLLTNLAMSQGVERFDPGRKQSARSKYESLGEAVWGREWNIPVTVTRGRDKRFVSDYGKAGPGRDHQQGRIVMTGQPQNFKPSMLEDKRHGAGNPKHHDFFFYGDAGAAYDVTELRETFENVHADTGQQGRNEVKPNEEWEFWRARLQNGERVPVFFLLDKKGDNIRAFGLAMMFRLAYDLSVKDVVKNAQPDMDSDRPDLAELIFGYVRTGESRAGVGRGLLKGRVSIGHGGAVGKPRSAGLIQAVLGVPKPTYYPNYVVQGGDPGRGPGKGLKGAHEWTTYMADGSRPKARGWKRAIARQYADGEPHIPAKATDRVKTKFKPLMQGTKFRAKLRVHNLRPMELGALLWALDFGGRPQCRHSLGMATTLGYGSVTLSVVQGSAKLTRNDRAAVDLASCVEDFRAYMEANVPGGWEQSEQIFQLVQLATPTDADHVRHMRLDHPVYGNEFQAAKKSGLALPLHGSLADFREWTQTVTPASARDDATGEGGLVKEDVVLRPNEAPEELMDLSEIPKVLEVTFEDLNGARTSRKSRAKDLKRGRDRERKVTLRPTDPEVAKVIPVLRGSTTISAGLDEIFEVLRGATANIVFFAEWEQVDGGYVATALRVEA